MKISMLKRIGAGVLASSLALVAFTATTAEAARLKVSTLTFDFNTPGALATDFSTYIQSGTLVQSATDGLAGSGSISPDQVNQTNATVQPNANYSMGPIGSKYTFSGFMKSQGSSGYSGFGFTALDNTAANVDDSIAGVFRPLDAFGVSVHGGGWELHNGADNYEGNWAGSGGTATDVKTFSGGDLIGNASVSPDNWYKIVFVLNKTAATKFSVRFEVWAANADGTLRSNEADAIFEKADLSNPGISAATELSSYINFSGYRMTQFDNFQTTVVGAKISGAPAGSVTEEPDPVTPTAGKKTVSGFFGDSWWINGKVTKGLKALATSPSAITAIKCTGTTAGTKATPFDKKLALNRATAACAFLKKLAPSAKVTTAAKPATGKSYSNRAVIVEITR